MIVNRYIFVLLLGTAFVTLSTLKYQKTENDTINPQFQLQSQENDKDWGKFPTFPTFPTLVGHKESCLPMASFCGFAGLAVGGLTAFVVVYKWISDKWLEVFAILMDQKTELEQQRDRLRGELEEVEAEKDENKKKLQSVETEITEKEKTLKKPEELLNEKENLLQAQWKLDERKKNCEKLKKSIKKLLEPLELHISRMRKWRDDHLKSAEQT